ncbi:hypothetical protein GCM10009854_18500 [Saccharopolyspora halophila]|uniref:Uncharacterized protein n=1 Tax=Saccharopolyspora halophila TaxID=405551 RepID=A0ABN3G1H1_9PSEU
MLRPQRVQRDVHGRVQLDDADPAARRDPGGGGDEGDVRGADHRGHRRGALDRVAVLLGLETGAAAVLDEQVGVAGW